MKQANKIELVGLLKIARDKGATKAAKVPAPKPEAVDKGLHALCLKMVSADVRFDTAQNAVFETFKAYVQAYLPLGVNMATHTAAVLDIKTTYGEARAPAAIQRITMLNNIRTIAHGKAATRNTPAQPAQGIEPVLKVLSTMTSLPALKKALTLLKTATHAATGIAKHTISDAKPVKTATMKAVDVVMPGTRAEALKAACKILEMVSTTFLTISKDSATIDKVAEVIKLLRAA